MMITNVGNDVDDNCGPNEKVTRSCSEITQMILVKSQRLCFWHLVTRSPRPSTVSGTTLLN